MQIEIDREKIIDAIYEDGNAVIEIIRHEQFGEYLKKNIIIYIWGKDLSLNIIPEFTRNKSKGWQVIIDIEEIIDLSHGHIGEEELDLFIQNISNLLEKLKTMRHEKEK